LVLKKEACANSQKGRSGCGEVEGPAYAKSKRIKTMGNRSIARVNCKKGAPVSSKKKEKRNGGRMEKKPGGERKGRAQFEQCLKDSIINIETRPK